MQFVGAMIGLVLIAVLLTSPVWLTGLVVWAIVANRRGARRQLAVPQAYPGAWPAPATPQLVHVQHHVQQVVFVQVTQTRGAGREHVVIDGGSVNSARPELRALEAVPQARSPYDAYCHWPAEPGQR